MSQDYKSLLETVKHHAKLYYDLNKPVLTDQEYDQLYDRLAKIEERQGWADSSSPTIAVGGSPGKVKHPYNLYSLKKVYDVEEIDSSFEVETIKIDGANLSITYGGNGKFRHALTRGDGEFGEDVSHLAVYINGIPKSIKKPNNTVTFVGEVVTDKDNVTNFRNFVSGSLGVKKAGEIKDRKLKFIVHDVLGIDENYTDRINYANELGLFTVLHTDCSVYPSDGKVFRVNSRSKERLLGYTSKHPRFAVALKERSALTAVTTIQDVVWSLGRTGVVTPVAIVEPVIIDDATISRVILHNIDFIEEHNLGPGDEVVIERQITPQFVKVLNRSSFARFSVDDAEKQLGMSLQKKGPKLFATKTDSSRIIEYYAKQLGIKGLGPKSIEKLNIDHPGDLYNENLDWSVLGKNGEKIQQELYRPKPYSSLLASLGIPGVGKTTAKSIVEKLPSFDRLKEIEYEPIKNIGPKTVENILAWLEINEEWVSKLPYDLQESIASEDEEIVVVISGKLDMTKSELAFHLKEYGVIVKDAVSKHVDYVISSGEVTTKTEKAKQYGIPIVNYWKNRTAILKGEFNGRSD